MDAIELLEHDHPMVEQLFRDYEAAASATQRRGVVELLIRELDQPPALALAAPVAAIYDRLRDRLGGRPRK